MNTTIKQYVNSTRLPVKYGKLYPGSLFRIVAERKFAKTRRSNDRSIYRISEKGFYGTNVVTGEGIVLDFDDIVQPVKLEKV